MKKYLHIFSICIAGTLCLFGCGNQISETDDIELQTYVTSNTDGTKNINDILPDDDDSSVNGGLVYAGDEILVESMDISVSSIYLKSNEYYTPIITFYPSNADNKNAVYTSSDPTIAAVDEEGHIQAVGEGTCTVTVTSAGNPNVSQNITVTVSQNAQTDKSTKKNDINALTYVNGLLVVNKTYGLPSDYNPGIDDDAAVAFEEMQKAAFTENGYELFISSGFCSYDSQETIYNNYAALYGIENADKKYERAGYSEHQAGVAFDLNTADYAFTQSAEYAWVAANCHKYGFIIRYPVGKETFTGYEAQPWHIRYVGVDAATAIYESGMCLEEFLGITSEYAPDLEVTTGIVSTLYPTSETQVSVVSESVSDTSSVSETTVSETEHFGIDPVQTVPIG